MPARRAFQAVTARQWAAVAGAVAISVLPTIVTHFHGHDILASTTGDRMYAYGSLRPGTPLEAIALSTPGIGFQWTDYGSPKASFDVHVKGGGGGFSSYGYLGMLTLPLACLGLVFGRRYWSLRLRRRYRRWCHRLHALGLQSDLFADSGLELAVARGQSFQRHAFRLGLYALFLLAAGVGWTRCSPDARPGHGFFWTFFPHVVGVDHLAGQAAERRDIELPLWADTWHSAFSIAWRWRDWPPPGPTRIDAWRFLTLLPLFLVDTSTFAFAHERLSLVDAAALTKDPGPNIVGTRSGLIAQGGFLYLRGIDRRAADELNVRPTLVLAKPADGRPAVGPDGLTGRAHLQRRVDPPRRLGGEPSRVARRLLPLLARVGQRPRSANRAHERRHESGFRFLGESQRWCSASRRRHCGCWSRQLPSDPGRRRDLRVDPCSSAHGG